MAKIQGLGGAFFHIEGDYPQLLEWYRQVLKLNVTEYGIEVPNNIPILVTLKRNESMAYINFIVDDIYAFVEYLRGREVEIISDIETYEYGLFCQIKDIAGNVIELFEVNHETYFEMVEKEKEAYLKKRNASK